MRGLTELLLQSNIKFPISWTIFHTVTWSLEQTNWHWSITTFSFSCGIVSFISMEFTTVPKHYILWQVFITDFLKCTRKPRFCNTKIIVSLAIINSFWDIAISRMLCKSRISSIFNFLSIAIGTFMSFINTSDAEAYPNQRQGNWYNFCFHWNFT